MIYFFIAIIFAAILLTFLEDRLGKFNIYVYCLFGATLIIACALKSLGVDADSEAYEELFNNSDSEKNEIPVEYSFIFFSSYLKYLIDDVHIIFFLYALLGITLKFVAIRRLSAFYFMPIVVYLGNYFILHDFTQIRVSVASGLLLMSLKPLAEGKRWHTVLYLLCAVFFHYSSLILFLILFFSNKPLNRTWKIGLISIIPIGLILFVLKLDIISFIPIPFIQDKVEIYKTLTDIGFFEAVSLKSPFLWLKVFIMLYTLYFYDTIAEYCIFLPVLLKVLGLSLFFFFAFSRVPVLSGRVYELFGIVELVLFPCIFYTIKPKAVSQAVVCLIGCIEFVFTVFIWKLLTF